MRFVLCMFAAIVAGTGLATVLALGTAGVTAALYKSEAGVTEPVAAQVQASSPAIRAAAVVGFVIGSGVIVWMFATSKVPADPSENGASEV